MRKNAINNNTTKKYIFILTLIWIILDILTMLYINNEFLSNADENFIRTAKISSYLTILINSSLIPFFTLLLFLMPWYLSNLLEINLKKEDVLEAIFYFILCFVFYEVFRFINAFLFLANNVNISPISNNFDMYVTNLAWYKIQQIMDIILIFTSTLIFTIVLKNKSKLNLKKLLPFSILVLILLFTYNYKFIVYIYNKL